MNWVAANFDGDLPECGGRLGQTFARGFGGPSGRP
jgi:hypothetical protein